MHTFIGRGGGTAARRGKGARGGAGGDRPCKERAPAGGGAGPRGRRRAPRGHTSPAGRTGRSSLGGAGRCGRATRSCGEGRRGLPRQPRGPRTPSRQGEGPAAAGRPRRTRKGTFARGWGGRTHLNASPEAPQASSPPTRTSPAASEERGGKGRSGCPAVFSSAFPAIGLRKAISSRLPSSARCWNRKLGRPIRSRQARPRPRRHVQAVRGPHQRVPTR